MRSLPILTVLLLSAVFGLAAWDDFGVYYPHTRWIAKGRHHIQVDVFTDRLVIAEGGKPIVVLHGCWKGRSFFKDCDVDYFDVAHEGLDAGFTPASALAKYDFKRIKPDPKT